MKVTMKILLIGEYCLDRYVKGVVPRMSPEAPCCVFEPFETSENDGMAGNVYNNMMAMMPNTEITKVFFKTGTKTRYIDVNSGYQLMRLDENIKPTSQTNYSTIFKKDYPYDFFGDLKQYDAIVISDYNKGFITDDLIQRINDHPLVFVDTKRTDLSIFKNAIIKINKKEYDNVKKYHTGKLIVTLGKDGALYENNIYPVENTPVKDLSGAGDTFLSALALYHTSGFSLEESIIKANVAATIAVEKSGTSVVYKDELEERLNGQAKG